MTDKKLVEALQKVAAKLTAMDKEELLQLLEKHTHGDVARALNYMNNPNYYDYLNCVCGSNDITETLTPMHTGPDKSIFVSTFECRCNACGYVWTPSEETNRVSKYLQAVLEARKEKDGPESI